MTGLHGCNHARCEDQPSAALVIPAYFPAASRVRTLLKSYIAEKKRETLRMPKRVRVIIMYVCLCENQIIVLQRRLLVATAQLPAPLAEMLREMQRWLQRRCWSGLLSLSSSRRSSLRVSVRCQRCDRRAKNAPVGRGGRPKRLEGRLAVDTPRLGR